MNEKVEKERDRVGAVTMFAVKACIVAVVISAATIFTVDWIISDVSEALANTPLGDTLRGGPKFWGKIERELDRAADPANDLPPERKQKLINDVRVIVQRWRPFVEAVQTELQKSPDKNNNN